MRSLILGVAAQFILPILMLYSLFLLVRGHNEPGGGFVGGLMAATAVTLRAIAADVASARRLLWLRPHTLIGLGLVLALGSGLWTLAVRLPYLTAAWGEVFVPGIGVVELGTPLLFEAGVYITVAGATLLILLSLAE